MTSPGLSIQEKINLHSIPEPITGCLIWTASTSKEGYGNIWHKNKCYRAHRVAWEIAFGTIEKSALVCHKCDTPSCINTNHLFLGTSKDNSADKINKRRDHNLNKKYCKNNHEFSTENTKITKLGHRRCKKCDRISSAKYKREKKNG